MNERQLHVGSGSFSFATDERARANGKAGKSVRPPRGEKTNTKPRRLLIGSSPQPVEMCQSVERDVAKRGEEREKKEKEDGRGKGVGKREGEKGF